MRPVGESGEQKLKGIPQALQNHLQIQDDATVLQNRHALRDHQSPAQITSKAHEDAGQFLASTCIF